METVDRVREVVCLIFSEVDVPDKGQRVEMYAREIARLKKVYDEAHARTKPKRNAQFEPFVMGMFSFMSMGFRFNGTVVSGEDEFLQRWLPRGTCVEAVTKGRVRQSHECTGCQWIRSVLGETCGSAQVPVEMRVVAYSVLVDQDRLLLKKRNEGEHSVPRETFLRKRVVTLTWAEEHAFKQTSCP